MSSKPIAMRDALLESIWKTMGINEKVFFVCADFGSPVLDKIRSDFASRFVNVGVAEQNLINVSAGLALEGYTIFAYAIAPFITMRCYEQTRVSLALLSQIRPMNVNLIGVGAGYSYVVSGPTHQCYEDITLMRAMPNFRVLSPSDHVTSAALVDVCMQNIGPKYLRLDAQVLPKLYESAQYAVKKGFQVHLKGDAVCLVATGYMLHTALKVASKFNQKNILIGVIDLIDLYGFDKVQLSTELRSYKKIVSLEEGFKGRGGMDALLFNLLNEESGGPQLVNLGVEGVYRFELGTRAELHELVGIGQMVVERRVNNILKEIATKTYSLEKK
jgi:transketolase